VLTVRFLAGTVELRGLPEGAPVVPPRFKWDERTACHRGVGLDYPALIRALHTAKLEYTDEARAYAELPPLDVPMPDPRPYQTESIAAWKRQGRRGVVVLPTGAGKSHVAALAIADARRSTLVVAPTLDLVRQWYDNLGALYGSLIGPIGVVGGGEHEVRPITITTYDSAHIHAQNFGHRFGLLVFDECHHLPGEAYALAARLMIAPFRLGLTATPERADGKEAELEGLIGPTVYRKDIKELSGNYLAEYDLERIEVELSPSERVEYDAARATYRGFVVRQGIRVGTPKGWATFIQRAAGSDEGRRALDAYRRQRALALAAPAKLSIVDTLLTRHAQDRTLLFTEDNAMAYAVSRRFLIPVITHQTKVKERSRILADLNAGTIGAVVTSKVLNEGVDVPDARVAIVISGSGSVREHVQRLGRVLRARHGKRAQLYELVTKDTGEGYTSERRREHDAYRP
jgi:superfamily II DNA or RNA helicase